MAFGFAVVGSLSLSVIAVFQDSWRPPLKPFRKSKGAAQLSLKRIEGISGEIHVMFFVNGECISNQSHNFECQNVTPKVPFHITEETCLVGVLLIKHPPGL